jgi:hypothetical protein
MPYLSSFVQTVSSQRLTNLFVNVYSIDERMSVEETALCVMFCILPFFLRGLAERLRIGHRCP